MNSRIVFFLCAALAVAGCNRSEKTPPAPPPTQPAEPATPTTGLPPGHPPIDMRSQTLPPGTTADAPNPQWTVPPGWEAGPASSVRRASFVVNGPTGQSVDIAVTVFPGDVGGMPANINRWRSQIGLAPATDVATTSLDIAGVTATLVDFANDATGKRMIVATIPHAGNSWFFKMTGDAPLVEAQKEAFLEFVKSVKF
jgi:hypothetical protein